MGDRGVSLKEHTDEARSADRALTAVALIGVVCAFGAVVWGMQKATKVALNAADEKGAHHNNLIDRMREMSKQYVTWPVVLLLIGLALSLADKLPKF